MLVFEWPEHLRPNKEIEWRLVNSSKSGGKATNGFEQVVAGPGGVWVGSGTFLLNISKYGREWRLFRQRLSDRVNAAWIDLKDPLYCGSDELVFTGIGPEIESVRFSDTALFSDGSGFAPPPYGLAFSTTSAAGSAFVDIAYSDDMPAGFAGSLITIDDWLYMVDFVERIDASTHQLRLIPPLRENVVPGQSIILLSPKVLVKFTEVDSSRFSVSASGYAEIQIEVHEVLNRDGLS